MLFFDFQMKELRFYMYPERLKYLQLNDPGMASYTYKALGAGFWALRQKDFRQALEEIVLEVSDTYMTIGNCIKVDIHIQKIYCIL